MQCRKGYATDLSLINHAHIATCDPSTSFKNFTEVENESVASGKGRTKRLDPRYQGCAWLSLVSARSRSPTATHSRPHRAGPARKGLRDLCSKGISNFALCSKRWKKALFRKKKGHPQGRSFVKDFRLTKTKTKTNRVPLLSNKLANERTP